MDALVSILIPTYDRALMLQTAVASALAQTHENLEVLIGIDKGTPQVLEVTRSFKDPRVRVFTWKRNRGPYPVYESLLKEARGDYVLMFSDDDRLEPLFLEHCLQALEKTGKGYAWTDDIPWDGEKPVPDSRTGRTMQFLFPGVNSSLLRRSVLMQVAQAHGTVFHPDLRLNGDCVLFYHLSVLLGPDGAVHVPERLVWNRMHPQQLSRNPRLWSLVEDIIVGRTIGRPMKFRHAVSTLIWLLKKKAEAVAKQPLPPFRAGPGEG